MQGGVNRAGRLEEVGLLSFPCESRKVFFSPWGSWKERVGFQFYNSQQENNRLEKGVSGKHCHEMTLAPSRRLFPRGEASGTEVYELNIDFFSCPPHTFFFWMTVQGFVGWHQVHCDPAFSVTLQPPKAGPGTTLPFHRTIKCSGSELIRLVYLLLTTITWGRYALALVLRDFNVYPETDGTLPSGTGREKS